MLIDAQQRRLIGDYRTSQELTSEEAREEISAATAFLDAAREYLDQQHSDESK